MLRCPRCNARLATTYVEDRYYCILCSRTFAVSLTEDRLFPFGDDERLKALSDFVEEVYGGKDNNKEEG